MKKRMRIAILVLLFVSAVFVACSGQRQNSASAPESGDNPLHALSHASLKDAYADFFMLGTIYTTDITGGKDYKLVTKHFNQITPENIMKPDATQPTEGTFTLDAARKMMAFAEKEKMRVNGHVLAWHQQTAAWMGQTDDREVAIRQLKNHIEGVAGAFAGKIASWDVVNEAIQDSTTLPADGDWTKCLRESQWTKSIGPDYIALAFQFAREAAPDAVLYYNDYNLNEPAKAAIVAAMVRDLRARGVPVDGIGMQGHYNTETYIPNVRNALELFSKIDGVKISVSELDVSITGLSSGTPGDEQEMAQAIVYGKLFSLYKEFADKIERVTFWGYKDSTSWRSGAAPLLWDAQLNPKEAFYAVMNPEAYAALAPEEEGNKVKRAAAAYGTPTVDGEIDAVWSGAEKYDISTALFAWQGADGTVQMLWDEQFLYALFDVRDKDLNNTATNAYEQDSVEFFLDQNNCKNTYYDSGCGQYRCSYTGYVTFGDVPANGKENFDAKATVKSGGYVVEIKIPLIQAGARGTCMGFDAQVNDANDQGVRQSIMKFNATTNEAYVNPSLWGEVVFE